MSNISSNNGKIVNPEHQFIMVDDIQSAYGFFKFYFENLKMYPDKATCFAYCNEYFYLKYGYYRYNNYNEFAGGSVKVSSQLSAALLSEVNSSIKASDVKLREFLMILFKEKGFDSWVSFRPLVLHYYPQIHPDKLKSFYNGSECDKEVLKLVDFVRQIIG